MVFISEAFIWCITKDRVYFISLILLDLCMKLYHTYNSSPTKSGLSLL